MSKHFGPPLTDEEFEAAYGNGSLTNTAQFGMSTKTLVERTSADMRKDDARLDLHKTETISDEKPAFGDTLNQQ